MQRHCNGTSTSGTDSKGVLCRCGALFDDGVQWINYPHVFISTLIPDTITSPRIQNLYYPVLQPPSAQILESMSCERLAAAYSTLVKPGEKIVVCVDSDVSAEFLARLKQEMEANRISGIIVPGARAGTGCLIPSAVTGPDSPAVKQLEILARIGDCWQQCPGVLLSELLAWFRNMNFIASSKISDEYFAAATEVHFKKVYGGFYGENK